MFGKKPVWAAVVAFLTVLTLTIAGCGGDETSGPGEPNGPETSAKALLINCAGASFPYPLYSQWIHEYGKLEPRVNINYQSIGSGAGIEQISKKVIDFGGSDAPMTDEKLNQAPGAIMHIPTVLGAVAITYNLPGIKQQIRFTPNVLADIYLGKIDRWNDPRLVQINPGVALPDQKIMVAHRSDGSGTTNIFTDYLSTVSSEWQETVGKGTSVQWPTGMGAKGSEGVSRQVQTTTGSIGYVELSYALLNKLPYGLVANRTGRFVNPSIETTTAAAAGAAPDMPEDLRVSIVDPPGENAYSIAGYTYILVYREQDAPDKGKALAEFLWWAVHQGEKMASELSYAPLPSEVVAKVEEKIKSMTCQGKSLLQIRS